MCTGSVSFPPACLGHPVAVWHLFPSASQDPPTRGFLALDVLQGYAHQQHHGAPHRG